MQILIDAAGKVLTHIESYLGQLTDDQFTQPRPLLSEASIGGHTRHILDGYLCLMRQEAAGTINYDQRERDAGIENSTMSARAAIANIRSYLKGLHRKGDFSLEVDYGTMPFRSPSSLERELIHNIEHTIHHLAIVKIALLAYCSEVRIPADFGVAPSTLRYWENKAVKAAG